MPTEIKVICKPDENAGYKIRQLFCKESSVQPKQGRNPLTETEFNALLDEIAQSAFNEGRSFEKKHPKLT